MNATAEGFAPDFKMNRTTICGKTKQKDSKFGGTDLSPKSMTLPLGHKIMTVRNQSRQKNYDLGENS